MRKQRVGIVVSDKMKKTVIVEVLKESRHPLYGKVIKKRNKFKAHDEEGICKVGDKVKILETRPLSHDKRWVVTQVLSKGSQSDTGTI